jgi:outer membrane protein OmpA-like peptidoglycan-associated protein
VVPVPLAAAPAGDQTGATTQLHEEDQTPARDDGILAEHRYYDEGGGAKDDGILGSSRYSDEYLSTARGDGINALNQYHDEGGGAARDDGIIAHNVYGNDDSGAKSESVPGQPKAFPQGNETAAAAANKLPAITMLPVTITVEADPLFDFDQAAVREDSRKKLDDLIQQLQGVTYGDVIVVGFADPIGTAIYNQSLSWRRAESVEQYLAKHGLPASRIRAEGRGETEEFATFESCGGIRNEQAIACLQPDRRVEVTITAKRQHQASN